MVMLESRDILRRAASELDERGIPANEIQDSLRELEAAIHRGDHVDGMKEPYFIPNDLSMCTPFSVLSCSHADQELEVPAGFSIEASATKPGTFAKPYYIDPVTAVRRCKGLFALETYTDRLAWAHDLSFVGHHGKHNERATQGILADTANTRFLFLQAFAGSYLEAGKAKIHFHTNDRFFFVTDPTIIAEDRERRNKDNRYIESIQDSRFVLCPRGCGPSSIRFFETLASGNIPIYVGERRTKLPLEWIIDWDTACFRISCEEVADGSWSPRLDEILATPIEEVNRRRRYIFRIYHQLLAPERKRVFEHLVILKARAILRAAPLSVTAEDCGTRETTPRRAGEPGIAERDRATRR